MTLVSDLVGQRRIIWQFAKREVQQRYRGSYLGIFWSFLTPLITLAVYTFVFSFLFHSRWSSSADEGRFAFAMVTFCGLITFNLFSESANKAPSVIIGNPNYVKKVVFPLQVLPVASTVASVVHMGFGLIILLVALIATKSLSVFALLFPIVMVPLLLLSLAAAFLIASLSVFLRDIAHIIAVITPLLMFMSAVLYPASALPPEVHFITVANPLIPIIENLRAVLVLNQLPNWLSLARVTVMGAVALQLSYAWFMLSRRWFADVV